MRMPKLISTEQLEKAESDRQINMLPQTAEEASKKYPVTHLEGDKPLPKEYSLPPQKRSKKLQALEDERLDLIRQIRESKNVQKWQPKFKVPTARGRKQRQGYSNIGQHSGRQGLAHGYVEQMKKGDTPMVTDEQQRLNDAAVQLEKVFGLERAASAFGIGRKKRKEGEGYSGWAARNRRLTRERDAVRAKRSAVTGAITGAGRAAASGAARGTRAAASGAVKGTRSAASGAARGTRATGRGVRAVAEYAEPAGVQRGRGGGPAARAKKGSDFDSRPTGSEGPPGRSFGSKLKRAAGAVGRNIASGAKEFGAGLKEGSEELTRPFNKPTGGESVPLKPSSGSRAPKKGWGGGAAPGAAKPSPSSGAKKVDPTKPVWGQNMQKAMISLQKISDGDIFIQNADPNASPAEKGRRNLEAQKTRAMRAERVEGTTEMPFSTVMPGTPNTPQARREGTKAYNTMVRAGDKSGATVGKVRDTARGTARAARYQGTAETMKMGSGSKNLKKSADSECSGSD